MAAFHCQARGKRGAEYSEKARHELVRLGMNIAS
jgi:hypothetical protein